MRRVIVALVLAVLPAACAGEASIPTDPVTGLEILSSLPPLRGSAAVTEWRDSSDTPDGMGAGTTTHTAIGDLVDALRQLASEEGVELAVGFVGPPGGAEATLVVHVAGSEDPAVAGDELVLELRRNERGWYVDSVRYRNHCRHAVDPATGSCA